jgi:hypothetical protein
MDWKHYWNNFNNSSSFAGGFSIYSSFTFAHYRESEAVSEVYRRKKEILPLAFQLILHETVPKDLIDGVRKYVQKDTRNAVLKLKDELLEFFQ